MEIKKNCEILHVEHIVKWMWKHGENKIGTVNKMRF